MKDNQKNKVEKKQLRSRRVGAKIFGTAKRPRAVIHRSLKHIYVQLINDEKSKTLVATSDLELKKDQQKAKGTVKAQAVGKLLAQKAKQAKIDQIAFDRRSYKYHGRVKALADGMREEGIKF